jgi:YVTN family beta-propeller protein
MSPNRFVSPACQFLVVLAAVVGVGAWAARRPAARPAAPGATRPPASDRGEPPALILGRVVREGIQVECRIVPLGREGEGGRPGPPREGRDARFEFAVTDTTGGSPLSKTYPSAWMVARPEGAPPATSKETAQELESLINGSLFTPPELDLNTFYVVTLNHNATISVVDPLFGFGGTKLLALVPLAGPGSDWAAGRDGRSIFVAIPAANQVAVVDTESWKVAATAPGGVRPRRLAVQPDGHYLWVAGGAPGSDDAGVTVLTTSDLRVAARIRTGPGATDLAFSDDSRTAFVVNATGGTVSIVDIGTLRPVATVRTGRRPGSIAYSSRAGLAYVTDAADGTVCTVDARERRVANRIEIEPGLGAIRFSPDGGLAVVVNPERNMVYVIDPSTNRVVQRAKVDEGPDRVSFSSDFAYIRHRRSINVVMIALKSAGREGALPSLNRFPAGQSPPGAMDDATPADSIVPAPGAGAVLVANPRDQSVYYYREGLAAPMGTFNNYKRQPRAILVIDRSLRERSRPGVYETTARLDRPGRFDVVFLLDQPRIVHAFPITVEPDPARDLERKRRRVDVEPLVSVGRVDSGALFRPLFELTGPDPGVAKTGLADVELLMYRVGGGWQDRRSAREVAPGVYGADFTPGLPGVYHVFIACASIGLTLNNPHRLIVEVTDPAASSTPAGTPTSTAPRPLPPGPLGRASAFPNPPETLDR